MKTDFQQSPVADALWVGRCSKSQVVEIVLLSIVHSLVFKMVFFKVLFVHFNNVENDNFGALLEY